MDWIAYTKTLLQQKNLVGWTAEVSRGRRTIGLCSYTDKTIYLSKHHIENDSYDDVRDTVIHEVAHALNPLDGHGNKWRQSAMAMGGTGDQYHSHGSSYPSKWTTRCINGHAPKVYRWNKDTIYICKCGAPLYIKRTDGTRETLGPSYVQRFNYLAQRRQVPQIDSHGIPQL